MGELIALLDGATGHLDGATGLTAAYCAYNAAWCDAENLVEFVTVTSDFYPELEPGYEEEGQRLPDPSGLPVSGFCLGWNRRNRGVWFDWSSARRAERTGASFFHRS